MRKKVQVSKGEQASKHLGSREVPRGREGTTDTCVGGDWPGDLTRQKNSQTCTSAWSRKSLSRILMPYHFLLPQMSKPVVHMAPPKAKGCPQPPWCPVSSERLSTWTCLALRAFLHTALGFPREVKCLGDSGRWPHLGSRSPGVETRITAVC